MEGRQILDASLIANEVIDSILKKERGLLYKLDIEKAYDQIDWSFVLKRMGFGEKWTSWIKWCISIASFLVLVMGVQQAFLGVLEGYGKGTLYRRTCLCLAWKPSP